MDDYGQSADVGCLFFRALKKKSARKRTKSKTFAGVEGVDLDAGADLLNK